MIWTLLVATAGMAWNPSHAKAMLAPTETTAPGSGSGPNRVEDLQKVQRVLENKVVRQRLEDMGLTPEEINARLDRVSDVQMHQLAAQIDALLPGGDDGVLSTIALVLLIVVLVLILAILL
ncbi:MAG: PA2779 family protein [Nitrospiraceae bacterium]